MAAEIFADETLIIYPRPLSSVAASQISVFGGSAVAVPKSSSSPRSVALVASGRVTSSTVAVPVWWVPSGSSASTARAVCNEQVAR